MLQEESKTLIRPIISYPQIAEVGRSYLLTVDVHMEGRDVNEWPYEEEEYPITCILDTGSLFKQTAAGAREPVLLLHRFGRTYGPVRFLLTATREPRAGQIIVTLVNEFGVPIDFIFLHCEVKAAGSTDAVPIVPPITPLPSPPIVERSLTREQQLIEAQLQQVGWTIRSYDPTQSYIDLQASAETDGLAVRNFGDSENYVLFVFSEPGPIGIIQVLPVGTALPGLERKAPVISILDRQRTLSGREILPFVYLSTGYKPLFTNDTESNARSRETFTFHQPQTLNTWLQETSYDAKKSRSIPLADQLRAIPPMRRSELNDDQREAIQRLEKSFVTNQRRSLLRMDSGRNRTSTIIHSISRLISFTNTRRILYLTASAERLPLVQQAFKQYFSEERYSERSVRLDSVKQLDSSGTITGRVVIGDVETLYARQTGQEDSRISIVDEVHDETPGSSSFDYRSPAVDDDDDRADAPAESPPDNGGRYIYSESSSLEITYNPNFPIEMFDFIFIDGWFGEPYQQWSPLLGYFDAFLVGFSSVVDGTLSSFFQRNLVYDAELPRVQRQWAVLAGVDEYEDRNIPNLRGSSNDANLFRQLVLRNNDETRIHLLNSVSEPPTLHNIISALQQVGGETQLEDLLLFYFSGHGSLNESGTEVYFTVQDSSKDAPEATALSLSQVREIIVAAKARTKIIILDTCYAGTGILEEVSQSRSVEFVEHVIEESERIIVLASCSQNQMSQESYEWPSGPQGVFTHFLLEALSGRADVEDKGFVTVTDAYKYVSNEMKEWSRRAGRSQTPTLQSSIKEDVILSRY